MAPRPGHRRHIVGRLMGYIKRGYKARFIIVLVCILVSAIANVAGSLFLGSLIDDYITPCWVRRIQTFPAWCGPW